VFLSRGKQVQQEQRGTQDSPFVVKVLSNPKNVQETQQEVDHRKEKAANERNLVIATYSLELEFCNLSYSALKPLC
jgi:hypothetical protein